MFKYITMILLFLSSCTLQEVSYKRYNFSEIYVKKNDNKNIEVLGIVNMEFEGFAIYNSIEDLETYDETKSFWLVLSKKQAFEYKKFHKKKILIKGRYLMSETGHFSSWPKGGIKVDKMELTN